MIYTYFISYQYTTREGKWGFGRVEWPWPEPIERIDQIVELEKRLTLTNPTQSHIIMHYQLMRMDSESPTAAPAHDGLSAPDWPGSWRMPRHPGNPTGYAEGIQV